MNGAHYSPSLRPKGTHGFIVISEIKWDCVRLHNEADYRRYFPQVQPETSRRLPPCRPARLNDRLNAYKCLYLCLDVEVELGFSGLGERVIRQGDTPFKA